MTHVPAELARQYVADRLSEADQVRTGRRLAVGLRARRHARARARRAPLVAPAVGAERH